MVTNHHRSARRPGSQRATSHRGTEDPACPIVIAPIASWNASRSDEWSKQKFFCAALT